MAIEEDSGKGPVRISGAGTMAMYVLVGSLSMLFAASMLGYCFIRFHINMVAENAAATSSSLAVAVSHPWPPVGYPRLPGTLWLSTLVILLSSVTIQYALSGIKRGREKAMRVGLGLTGFLALAFLALQTLNWWEFTSQLTAAQHTGPYVNFFYVLTGLHAAHVIGGLIPLAVVTVFALKGRYSANFHPGVRYCAIYWHFLDVIWMMLFVMIYLI